MNGSTVAKYVTRVIHCRKTYAALALVGLIASLSGAAAAVVVAADKVAEPPPPGPTAAEELEQKIGAVQRETPEESVQMLIQDPLMERSFASCAGGKAYRNYIARDPRIAKLLDLARNGSEAQRASLLAEVKKMCRHFIEHLRLRPESPEDLSPTVAAPGGAIAYPLLLSVLDDKVETLPILLEMRARHREACRKWRAEEFEGHVGIGDEKAEQTYGLIQFELVVAYACWELLGKYERTPALRSALSPRQAQILAEFAEFNAGFIYDLRDPAGGYVVSNEKNIFVITQDFVQAADR